MLWLAIAIGTALSQQPKPHHQPTASHAPKALHATPIRHSNAEIHCVARAIYFEARGEPQSCREKVAHVIVNRMRHRMFPNSACNVVYQRNQFEWVKYNPQVRDHVAYQQAIKDATAVLQGKRDTTNGAQFFSTGYRFRNTRQVDRCGGHVFFRTTLT